MNDYLGNLVARTLGRMPVVQPRLASRFEPPESLVGFGAVGNAPSLFQQTAEPVEIEEEIEARPHRDQTARLSPRRKLRAEPVEAGDSPGDEKQPSQSSPAAPVFSIKTSSSQSSSDASNRSLPAAPEERVTLPRQPAPSQTQIERADNATKNFADLSPRRPEALIQPEARRADPLRQSEEERRERGEEKSNSQSPETASLAPPLQPVDWLPPIPPSAIASPPPPPLVDREPVIKVTIGRVEVRAVMPSPPAPPVTSAEQTSRIQAMPLSEYLRRRNNGEL